MTLVAALPLAGCPQLADDPFEKVDGDETTHSGMGGGNTSNSATSTTGLILDGAGGSSSSEDGSATTDGTTTGNVGAGAPGIGGDSGTSTSTTGGGGANEVPTTLVYAADDIIYAAAWEGAGLGPPTEWDSAPHPIAFVEARLAPDRSWALVGLQGGGEGGCELYLYRHFGAVTAPAVTLEIGEPDNCSSARAFDIAFEQETGSALVVYALPEGELAYHVIEAGALSDAEILVPTDASIAINWVRAVPDSASDRIMVGFTAEGSTRNSLFVQEWDGSKFDASHELVKSGSILYGESFDFAYSAGELIALRGDASKDGFGYNLRGMNGDWRAEVFRPDALNGNAQVIELRSMPYGVAGALFDATGEFASFGTMLWQDRSFIEETRLDNTLPDVANFEPASQKTDIQRLGNAAVTVYANAYEGEEDAASSLGWAVLRPESEWTMQQGALPIPFDQESRNAVTRSVRLARFTAEQEGLVLAFAEDGGLYVSSLTDLEVGFTPPELVDANVDGLSTTPFALIGP
ncbi:MAG TPA: hypothetical protein VFU02_07035 [Polyangiaceae bacterium]|nr:hypothetical protein [Polyangiaceae bacterium]